MNCVQLGIELALVQLKNKKKRESDKNLTTFSSANIGSVAVDIESSPNLSNTTDSPLPQSLHIRQISSHGDSVSNLSASEMSNVDQSTADLLEDANISCQTAVEILNDILSYDKLEANDMKLNFSHVNVKFLIERCVTPFLIQVILFYYYFLFLNIFLNIYCIII